MNDIVEMQSRAVTKAIRDQQEETKKLIAATEENKKRSFWSWLLKK
jgi:hypothetical protein